MKTPNNKKLTKQPVILSVLVLILAGAIFVNWKYAGTNGGLTTASTSSLKTGQAEFVATDEVEIETDYFQNVRDDREQNYDEAIDELEEIEESAKASEEDKSNAYSLHVKLVERMERESNIEALVKAKGFKECVAVINDNGVNIVVYADELADSEIIQIQDIVMTECDINLDNIKIINIK